MNPYKWSYKAFSAVIMERGGKYYGIAEKDATSDSVAFLVRFQGSSLNTAKVDLMRKVHAYETLMIDINRNATEK